MNTLPAHSGGKQTLKGQVSVSSAAQTILSSSGPFGSKPAVCRQSSLDTSLAGGVTCGGSDVTILSVRLSIPDVQIEVRKFATRASCFFLGLILNLISKLQLYEPIGEIGVRRRRVHGFGMQLSAAQLCLNLLISVICYTAAFGTL